MEVDGKSAASVQDASLLKKESAAVVDEKLNNAIVIEKNVDTVEPTSATEKEQFEKSKSSEADCSFTSPVEKVKTVIEEKDDLLDQIDEVCHDKVESSEDIRKASENEFLKKIEDLEKNDCEAKKIEEKSNRISMELKAKHIIDCEASAVDEIVVGDKILNVKEPTVAEKNKPSSASSTAEHTFNDITLPPAVNIKDNSDPNVKKSAANEVSSSSSETKTTHNIKTNPLNVTDALSKNSGDEPKVFATSKVESTGSKLTEENPIKENDDEKMDVTDECDKIDVVENEANTAIDFETSELMDVGEQVKENESLTVDENIEMISEENSLDNEDKPKQEIELNDVHMKETVTLKINKEKEENKSSDNKSFSDSSSSALSFTKTEDMGDQVIKEIKETKNNETGSLKLANHENDDERITAEQEVENKVLVDLKTVSKNPRKNIVSSSLTNTPVSSSNVFNSTPIQKQFEISSENVSKISNAAELSHTDKEEEATSSKPLTKSFEDSTTESGTCATSETDHPSSDGTTKKYIDAIKKYNGIPDTTTDEEETSAPTKKQITNKNFEIKLSQLSGSELKKDSTYEVNVCCEKNDVRYLSIERVDLSSNKNISETDKPIASESSIESSSNGSVNSLPAYSLPQTAETPTSVSTSASKSSSINCHSLIASQNKHTILGIEELCNFMINQFTKIKHAVNPESSKQVIATTLEQSTPTHQIKKNKKITPSEDTPSTSASKTKRARKRSLHEDDVESTPKAKQAKRDINKETPKFDETESEDSKVGPCVLAKWVDKKFYAGKITGEKPGNKFVVLFEDGASKILPRDSIVFGEGDTLPLQDQQVYALVDEDYENGVVLSIEKSSNKVYYNVKTENTTVKVTASDIYLEVDQAKEIQKIQNINKTSEVVEEEESFGTRPSRNKRPPASPSTPEAGYSGAVGKRGGKRQKRLPFNCAPPKHISQDSDSSDSFESTPPVSPKEKVGLELVEGVQPELQNTPNDSELARMIFVSDYKKCQLNCDIDHLLGPLPKSNTLFRNKHFLLTCTVGLRPHRYQQEIEENVKNNRFKQFSAVPYVKCHLHKQLESGGAKIYNYFEDVPKNKYKQCKLIAPRPCITAKYVQCLASDIQAISHDWVIDSCRQNKLSDFNKYQLPAGWSILAETFVQWKIGKNNLMRVSGQPFAKTYVLIAGEHSDFVELWGRVCKAAGAKLRLIKSLNDITPSTTGYMVTESDFSHSIKAKAQYYGIPIVSTVWIVQSLIMGAICPPNSHPRLTQLFEDEEI